MVELKPNLLFEFGFFHDESLLASNGRCAGDGAPGPGDAAGGTIQGTHSVGVAGACEIRPCE